MGNFSNINPAQKEAIETLEGPLLVLAGAGSGKTRVVTFRIVELLAHHVPAHQILGLTFTNKAAGEMRERVQSITNANVLICTFHSLGARILRESIEPLGIRSDFTIYDEEDVEKVLKLALEELNLNGKQDLKIYRQSISKAKNAMLTPEQVSSKDTYRLDDVFASYQAKLKEFNALDFDDLLYLTTQLLQKEPAVLAKYHDRWRYLLIDEYQDTNFAQYELVQLLVSKSGNICVVGDPDQSIYSWRGANIRNILDFAKDFPGAKIVRLEQNYRSTSTILEAANAVVQNNNDRYQKNLWSTLGAGEKIKHFTADNERGEAVFVADRIGYHRSIQQIPLNEICVFYRTNAQSRPFEDAFLNKRIPYAIVGGISFYQRREIKDILAFLKMVNSEFDAVSFSRTINIPRRGLGQATLEKILQGATLANLPILTFCETLVEGSTSIKMSAKQKEGLKSYISLIKLLKRVQEECSLKELVEKTIEESAYLTYLEEDPESFQDRKENLDSLIAKAIEWQSSASSPTLQLFLEELSLKSSLDETDAHKEHVNLMTIHNGKGLEFKVVFLVGLEQDLFPHINSRDQKGGLEEERRLFYVGMTRAKEYLYLANTLKRFIWGASRTQRPSCFLREIPPEYIDRVRLSHSPIRMEEEKVRFSDEWEEISPGDTVFHKEFGVGMLRNAYQGSLGLTYKVFFSNLDQEKTLVAKFANLIKL